MTTPTTSHRRRNALTGRWVLVSPHRLSRPWQGQADAPPAPSALQHDPECYLCPGNERAGGVRNPAYTGTFVFDNDFSALQAQAAAAAIDPGIDPLFQAEVMSGVCRVICYSPRHDLSLGQLDQSAVRGVIECWSTQWRSLQARDHIACALPFENRGAAMGASNPHPHGQIWASSTLPDEVALELHEQAQYKRLHGSTLLCDYVARELSAGERVVCAEGDWVAVVPFWAVWPFEILLAPKVPLSGFDELSPACAEAMASVLRRIAGAYDRVFNAPFPYTMGWHARPSAARASDGWVMHAHFYPPLLRSASVRKFQSGFEMLGMPQRDFTPEFAAGRLRECAQSQS